MEIINIKKVRLNWNPQAENDIGKYYRVLWKIAPGQNYYVKLYICKPINV